MYPQGDCNDGWGTSLLGGHRPESLGENMSRSVPTQAGHRPQTIVFDRSPVLETPANTFVCPRPRRRNTTMEEL